MFQEKMSKRLSALRSILTASSPKRDDGNEELIAPLTSVTLGEKEEKMCNLWKYQI